MTIIETKNAGDNKATDKMAEAFSNEVRINSVQTAIAAINTAFAANGNMPVNVFMGGHGNSTTFTMGDGQQAGTNRIRAADIGVNGTNTQKFIAAVKGKIRTLTLFGCSVGAGGGAFLQSLANAIKMGTTLPTCYGYDKSVCAAGGHWIIFSGTLSTIAGAALVCKTAQ